MKTAVEWLESKFNEFETIYDSLPIGVYEYVNQAKEMENKQQEDFAYWCEWRKDRVFKTYDELLKIYKNETKR
jgi:hypothetical protein